MTSLAIYSAGRNWVRLFTDEVIVADIVLVILPIFVVYAVSTYVRIFLISEKCAVKVSGVIKWKRI